MHYLQYLIVRSIICLIQMIPPRWCEYGVNPLAFAAADILRIRRAVIKDNLHRAFPTWTAEQRRRNTRAMWRHLLLMVVEIAYAHRKLHLAGWRKLLRVRQGSPFQLMETMFSGRPVVFVAGHHGNFELSTHIFGLLGFHGYAVARPLDNPHLDRFVRTFREQYGQRVLPKQGSADEIADMLERGGALCVLGDQHAGKKGCRVRFFGHEASTHKAIALFALQHNATLIVMSNCRRERLLQYDMTIEEVIDPNSAAESVDPVKEITQRFTTAIERGIRRHPEQYWWVHRRWKS